MTFIEALTVGLNIMCCIPSAASITKFDYWWVRGFDFPRIQICVLILINIILGFVVYDFDATLHFVLIGLLGFSLLYQLHLIFPYTYFGKKQVVDYGGEKNDDVISILVSNVLTENSNYGALIDLTRSKNPDILLTLESDEKWEEALSVLEDSFSHTVKVPLNNLYGMHLYSKLSLENIEVKYLVADNIPSIHGKLKLPNGKYATVHCLHPRPPSPSESRTSTNRDAELLLVGREIKDDAKLVLVLGDFNDVAWSRTTKLFQKMSGLLDPRRGRGFFNTYNANYKLLRWPLDHVFHSDDFTLMEIAREKNIGSDHFPIYIKLNYTPQASWKQEELETNEVERQWAENKIEKAQPERTEI